MAVNIRDLVIMGRKVHVAHADSPVLVGMLKESISKNRWTHIGFDAEYTANGVGPGSSQSVSLLQFATPETVFLFHVHGLSSLPSSLSGILTSRDIVKVGFDTGNDVRLTYDTFGVHINSVLDLQPLVYVLGCPGRGLGDAALHYSDIQLDKGTTSRDWRTLSIQKITYAAMDAIACVEIMKSLTPFLSTEKKVPAASLLPKPVFSSSVEAVSGTEVEALRRWFKTIQVAPTHEKRVNQIVNSYSPWIKYPPNEREALAHATLAQIPVETFLSPGGGPSLTPPLTPFPTPPTISSSLPIPMSRTLPRNGDEGRVHTFLKTILSGTRPRDKVLSQVVNSIGPLEGVSIQASIPEKRQYIDGLLERLVGRGLLVFPTAYEVAFPSK